MILVFFVPIVVVSAALIAWQLYTRRGQALDSAATRDRRAHETGGLRASQAAG
jgi:hypothetical protein